MRADDGRSRATRRRLTVAILDLVARKPTRSPYARLMNANFASIMPQAIAVWAEELGCEVRYEIYTGFEDLRRTLAGEFDVLFVSAFTPAAYLAYGISSQFRRQGVVTVLGGPHARAYADDARKHFDYVAGFTDKALVHDLLGNPAPHPDGGVTLSAARQPRDLPGVRQRWRFVRQALDKTRFVSAVPMIGSLGCPYRCSFCVDADVDYQTIPYDQIREDLVFLQRQLARPLVGWHDPNFGVRFDDYMAVIDDAVRPGSIRFVAESSLSLLSEDHVKSLARRGFEGLTIGIESWFDFGGKTGHGTTAGLDKAETVGRHIDMITRYVPYVQANFVWGLDRDAGPWPFELTRRFLDLAPAVFPAHNLFTAYGDSAPLGIELRREGRILDVPFQFLDTSSIHNVRLKNYAATEFYGHLADLVRYCYSPASMVRRFTRNTHALTNGSRWMNLVRSLSSAWRVSHYTRLQRLFGADPGFKAFGSGEGPPPREFLRTTVDAEGDSALAGFWRGGIPC